ncbi:MAG: hypothetical protein R2748_11605 [Bryobacterales bacterium]
MTQSPSTGGSATIAAGLDWTNREAAATIPRSQPLTLRWSGATREQVYVVGFSANDAKGASGVFVCTADAAVGQITVPAYVLGSLPASSKIGGQAFGGLMLGELFPQGEIGADGIAKAVLLSIAASGREAPFE